MNTYTFKVPRFFWFTRVVAKGLTIDQCYELARYFDEYQFTLEEPNDK